MDDEDGTSEELVVSRNFVSAGINGSFSTAWYLEQVRTQGDVGTHISAFEFRESLHRRLCSLFLAHHDENAKASRASAGCLSRCRLSDRGLWSFRTLSGVQRGKNPVLGVV